MRQIVTMLAVAFYCVTGFAQERRVSIFADHIYDVAKQQKVSYREAAQKIYDMGYRGADVRVDCDLLMLADLDAIGFRHASAIADINFSEGDIIYTAPVFKADGTYLYHPYVTVIHNGVVVQNHTEIYGTTEYIGVPRTVMHGDGPIRLQSHGDPSAPISFRNIWIREM